MNKIKHATKAIILARVSTSDQAKDEKLSVPAQLRNGRDYIKTGGKFGTLKETLAEFCFDESASKDRRKKFEKAIKIVETATEPIAIVVDKVDRFQRSFKETVRFNELRKDGKVEIHFVNQAGLVVHRNSSASEIMIWNMFVMMAESYVLALGDNVKRTIREKLKRKLFPGGLTPTGHLNVDVEISPDVIRKEIHIDNERAPFVKQCFELYATEKYSIAQITNILRKQGFTVKTKRVRIGGQLQERKPKLISVNDVARILREPFYYGKFNYKNPDTGERQLYPEEGLCASYEPLISEDLFEQVQGMLDQNSTRVNGYDKNKQFKFRGVLKCGFCGCKLTPEDLGHTWKDPNSAKAKEAIYYHCTNGKASVDPDFYKKKFGEDHSGRRVIKRGNRKGETVHRCPQGWWREADIEALLMNELALMNYGDNVLEYLRGELHADYEEQMELLNNRIKADKDQYTKNASLIEGLVLDMAAEKDPDMKEDIRKVHLKVKAEQAELKRNIATYETALEIDTDEIMRKLQYCNNLKDQYERLDEEGQINLVKSCFREIEVLRGEAKLNGKQRKNKKFNVMYAQWNEPFTTLFDSNLDELIAQWEENEKVLTKVKLTEAFPNP